MDKINDDEIWLSWNNYKNSYFKIIKGFPHNATLFNSDQCHNEGIVLKIVMWMLHEYEELTCYVYYYKNYQGSRSSDSK